MKRFDVLVIGSGAAGQTVAAACAKAGRRVAVIDRLPFGGTCSQRGCIPKKVLLAAAEAVGRAEALQDHGLASVPRIDWRELMRRKREFTEPVADSTLGWMREMGIETRAGTARFVSRDTVEVGGETLSAPAIVLATGARPVDLGIEGGDLVRTSADFLDLDEMPRRVVLVGGGYVSFEFAAIAYRTGAQVTIVHRAPRVLEGFESSLAGKLAERYRALGIRVLCGEAVERVERANGQEHAALRVIAGKREIEADAVFHGAGRVPDLGDLDLARGGVDHSKHGVTVDRTLRSVSNPGVWAAGDSAGLGPPLTPVAGAQGQVVAANLLGGHAEYDDSVTASVVFADPPLARVGLGSDAVAGDESLEVREFDMDSWFSQKRLGASTAGAVLVVDKGSERIRGAHLLGIGAEEIINVFALAMKFGITIADLRTMDWSYPTLSYEINYLTGRF